MSAIERWLQQQWYRSGPAQLALLPLSWLFGLLASMRRLAYRMGLLRSYKLPVPVIVVGNISIGGTGKTPFVLWLACPVWVGRDRVATAHALLAAHPQCDIIISDDGLQHYRLQRDIEIVMVDGERRFGNGHLLPAGPLREGRRRLHAVDAVVINGGGSDAAGYIMRIEADALHNLLDSTKTIQPAELAGQSICAMAGIGNPSRFFRQLRTLGLQFEQRRFPDHHAFQPADLQSLQADVILMTEKDAVKCAAFARANWWYLPVNAVVDLELLKHIMQKLRK